MAGGKPMGVKLLYLLDTNIVSEPPKPMPDRKTVTNIETYSDFSAISSVVWYELLKGIYTLPEGSRKDKLMRYACDTVKYVYPIIPYDDHCAALHADIYARMMKNGTPVSPFDMQIAATALANNMILVTRNVKDFAPIQAEYSLCVENWFE